MLRVNGLFGWVSLNDRRSAALFAGFVIAFHLLALVGLFVPLAISDPAHAPVYNWTGYLVRYVPLVTVAGAILFAVQMWWHVNTIRSKSGFRYTFKAEEPRLCRIAEPLVIAAGLPEPRLAVIESPALNAFACGLGRKGAVLVVTRGLLQGLDDDELAGVIAHELTHIRNGDVRLMAAANVCLQSIRVLNIRVQRKRNKYGEALALGVLAFQIPVLLIVLLTIGFLRQSAVRVGGLTRRLISSAREFVADAEAVRLTQNPAALVSALRKIGGHGHISDLPPEQDAMMIDGPSEGAEATHPGIAQRIEALVKYTGSMTFIAPARRDTRTMSAAAKPSFGKRNSNAIAMDMRETLRAARAAPPPVVASVLATAARQDASSEFNLLGLTREMTVAMLVAIAAFLYVHRADLMDRQKMAAQFDLRDFALLTEAMGKLRACNAQGLGSLVGATSKPTGCDDAELARGLAERAKEGSPIGKIFAGMAANGDGVRNGAFRQLSATDGTGAAGSSFADDVRRDRCFVTQHYTVGDRGLRQIGEQDSDWAGDVSITRYMGYIASSAEGAKFGGDAALGNYIGVRKAMIETIHRFYGRPGLDSAMAAYARPAHAAIVAKIANRLADPAYKASLTPTQVAEYELLTSAPGDFITCVARRNP